MRLSTAGRGWPVWVVVLVLIWPSCIIVKEDRRDCPCTLAVEMRSLPACPVQLYADGRLVGEAQRDTCLLVRVAKGPRARLAAVSGVGADAGFGSASAALELRIPFGAESSPLYAWSAVVDCSGDTGSATVQLARQHCYLSLEVVSPPGWSQPFQAAVRGEVDGWSLTASAPTYGPFCCTLDEGFRCRLPRQRSGNELWLDIVMPEGVVRTFSLGAALKKAGYDWTAPDLADIALRLDLSVAQLTLSYGVFSAVFPLEILI